MKMTDPIRNTLNILKKTRFSSYECMLNDITRREVNLEQGRLDILSTIEDSNLHLTGVQGECHASTRISCCTQEEVKESARSLRDIVGASPPDPLFCIAPFQEAPFKEKGPSKSDTTGMIDRIEELQEYCSSTFPELNLRRATLNFINHQQFYGNSNGTMLASRLGVYELSTIFSSRRREEKSSFNYVTLRFQDIEKPLYEIANLRDLFRQSVEQLNSCHIPASFTGDVILAPNCLDYFLYLLSVQLQDSALIRGTSLYQGELGQIVADDRFNFSVTPLNPQLASNSFITRDGFPAENQRVICNGVLDSLLLSYSGARKMGTRRGGYQGEFHNIQPGTVSFNEMISSIEKGLLMFRFSGGMPDENGSFSGVAKNSYYIENGKVKYPVKETMVRMNLRDMFVGVREISSERLNLGASLLPWIQVSGVPIE